MKYEAGNRFTPETYLKTEAESGTTVSLKVTGELEGVEVSFDSGDVPELTTLSATENRTYEAPEGTAYNEVTVNVPNTYTAADEGKVVDQGALVAQTSTTKTANGTYDTTLNNEVVVAVPGSSGSSYTLLHEEDLTIDIQSGTQVLKTVNIPGVYTSGSVIFAKVIDKAGFRNGYYYGSFCFSVNGNAGADSSNFTRNLCTSFKAVEYQNVHQYGQGNGWNSSGIFISKISSNDDVEISVTYNQNLGTMTGDYHIEIYKLDFPNNVNPFPLS